MDGRLKFMNLKIRKLEENIIDILNDSDVEIETKRLIVRNILYLIEKKSNEVITQEIQEGEQSNVIEQDVPKDCLEELPEH